MDFYASEFIAVPGTRSMSLSRMISEEKKEPTAAQSRRRAQNRAAQRAFRDRKERRIKDLEAKIKQLEEKSTSVDGENARLKKEIVRLTNINHMLRISSYKDDLDSYM
jgi:AP-1-like factor